MRIYSLIFSLLFSTLAMAAHVSNIVVFGDSLSDNGNLYKSTEGQLPSSPPYFEGRFSNGPVWAEQLLNKMFPDTKKLPLENYAFGGAVAFGDEQSMTLDMEISMFLHAHEQKAYSKNLYVIWMGSNDYLKKPTNPEESIKQVNKSIKKGMERLIDKGAKYFLIINLPDIGQSPSARLAHAERMLSELTTRHNQKLLHTVNAINEKQDVLALYFDVNTEFSHIIDHPEDAGFENVRDNCLTEEKEHHCENWLFFDSLHPTAKAHGLIADAVAHALGEARVHIIKKKS